jgi:hypothetical protein
VARFWSLSAILLLAAYSLRLAIRARFIRKGIENLKRNIADVASIPEGQNLPTSAWLMWVWKTPVILRSVFLGVMVVLTWLVCYFGRDETGRKFGLVFLGFLVLLLILGVCAFARLPLNPQIQRLSRFLLVLTSSTTPIILLWTLNPAWPRYIPLTGTMVCTLLGEVGLALFSSFLVWKRPTHLLRKLFGLYSIISPAFIIWYGEIPAIQTWKQQSKIAVTILSLFGMLSLRFVYIVMLRCWRRKSHFRQEE